MSKKLIQSTLFIAARFCLFALLLAAPGSAVFAQSTDDGFNPNADGLVNELAVQPDGKILAAGSFSSIGGGAQAGLARLSVTGKLDASFAPAVGGVAAIAFQSNNNKILIGGSFSTADSQTRNHLARLNYDGSLDTSFNPDVSGGTNPSVNAIVIQPDGKILIAGEFTTVGGQAHSRLARLNADGTPDASFNPDVSASVRAMVLQANGKILVGGTFTSVNSQNRNRIARLNADGSLDASYNPNASNFVISIALQADGKSIIGGGFTTVGGASHLSLVRLNTDGSVDAATPNLTGGVIRKIAVQPNGKILVGGGFSTPQGTVFLLRFNINGSADTQFSAQPDGFVNAIVFQSDNKTILGGQFGGCSFVKGQTLIYQETRNNLVRLESNDGVDRALVNVIGPANRNPTALIVQPDDKIIAAGGDDQLPPYIYRYEIDGQSDTNFSAVPNGKPFSLAYTPNGKILVGGGFTQINGQPAVALARLDATTGNADNAGTFNPQITKTGGSATIYSLLTRADGSIYAGGDFSAVNGQTRSGIVKLNADGSLNGGFTANTNGSVRTIAVRPDGKIVIGGNFTVVNGASRLRLAVLDPASGTLDDTQPIVNDNQVNAVVVQPDGKIIAGGTFTTAGNVERKGLARFNADGSLDADFNPINTGFNNQVPFINALALQADGRIIAAGQFFKINFNPVAQLRTNLARIKIDGTLDSEFGQTSLMLSDYLNAIALQSDGKIVFGENNRLGRLSNPTPVLQTLAVTRTGVSWTRDGASARFSRVSFEYSGDGISYSAIGEKTNVDASEVYTLTGANFPKNQNFYIRARGYYRESSNGETISAVETMRQFYLPVPVAANDSYTTNEDTTLSVPAPGVLANDTSINGLPLTATLLSQAAHGTVSFSSDGSFIYKPVADYNGADSFTYKVNDGQVDSDAGTVNITVNPVNDAPIAVNDSFTTNNISTLNVPAPGVLANDTDVDNEPLTAILVSASLNGTLNFNSNGSFTYTPNSGYIGTESFSYRTTDGTTNSNLATVTITVRDGHRVVTKTADTNDGVCNADCSLREAIATANSGDVISFASPLFDTARIITLSEGNGFRELSINKNLTIIGSGANRLTVRRAANATTQFRIFTIYGDIAVDLSGLTITGGSESNDAGGGIFNIRGSRLKVTNSYIVGNNAIYGGGIHNDGSSYLTLVGSTVSGNTADCTCGGGAGINSSGELTLSNTTVSGNVKTNGDGNSAGGIYTYSGLVTLINSTITDNQAPGANSAGGLFTVYPEIHIRDTIIAANRSNSSVPDIVNQDEGYIVSEGYNLIGNRGITTAFSEIGDQTGTGNAPLNPRLSVLNDFGGTTPTHALFSNSPAVNAGNPTAAVAADQRGVARTVGGRADIGAFELNFTFSNNPTGAGGNGTLPGGSVGTTYSVQLAGTRLAGIAGFRKEANAPGTNDVTSLGSPTYMVLSGNLAPGLTLNSASGVISGMPTSGGAYNLTVKVTDADGIAGAQPYMLNIMGPTAAGSGISGKILTADGRGLRNARINLTNSRGQTRTTLSSTFGYYRFADVAAGETYLISVVSKNYLFAPQVVNLHEELTELNFTAIAP